MKFVWLKWFCDSKINICFWYEFSFFLNYGLGVNISRGLVWDYKGVSVYII